MDSLVLPVINVPRLSISCTVIIIIVQKVHYEQRTNCTEKNAVRKSSRATVQSAEIISLI